MKLLLSGSNTNGSGLSNSASVEVLTGFILHSFFNFTQISNQELALIEQFSENRYNGVICGIMDQFSISMGKHDAAIFLDTTNLSFQYVPIKLERAKIAITNSNIESCGCSSKERSDHLWEADERQSCLPVG